MRILHTSDLHLREDKPERLEALKKVLALGGKEEVNLLLIAGDLFDSPLSASKLRPELRKLFSGNPFKILIIPGNHDEYSFRTDLYFGEDVEVLINRPYTIKDFPEIRIVGVPYFEGNIHDLLLQLKVARDKEKTNILLLHCTLDAPDIRKEDFGEEEKPRYLPLSSDLLAELKYDFLLAGHFHSRCVIHSLSTNSQFVYSGSPVSITRKEKGRRSVILIDTKGTIHPIFLDTFYYDQIEVIFHPFEEEKGLETLRQEISKHNLKKAELEVQLKGFINSSERQLQEEISNITGGIRTVDHRYRNISAIMENGLFRKFLAKLRESKLEKEEKEKIKRIVMEVFSDLEARGEI